MAEAIGEPRILKRAGEVDKNGNLYTPIALANAAKNYTAPLTAEKYGMITGLKFRGGELICNVYFPRGIKTEDIGLEMKGEVVRSKIVEDPEGETRYQLVEEFRVDSISLVDRAEAKERDKKTLNPSENVDGAPLYIPPKKLAVKEGEEVVVEGGSREVVGGEVPGRRGY